MPMTVITVTNVPSKLRGDLTKWMQEIATGVYVGNFNSKVRGQLWKRVIEGAGSGQATISYSGKNEIGYNFETFRTNHVNVDYDGIPLVMSPVLNNEDNTLKPGYSNASKFHQMKKFVKKKAESSKAELSYVVFDLETTGLDADNDHIIEIGAIRVEGKKQSEFQVFISNDNLLPKNIIEMTGITDKLISKEGKDIKLAMKAFADFVKDSPLVGYNVDFDRSFLQTTSNKINGSSFDRHQFIDIMKLVKKEKLFLDNYKFQTVLKAYDIAEIVQHRALEDSKLLAELATKVSGFQKTLKRSLEK